MRGLERRADVESKHRGEEERQRRESVGEDTNIRLSGRCHSALDTVTLVARASSLVRDAGVCTVYRDADIDSSGYKEHLAVEAAHQLLVAHLKNTYRYCAVALM